MTRLSEPPMNIVMVGPARFRTAPPYAGGLESFVDVLADALRRRGHRVEVVAGCSESVLPTARRDLPASPEESRCDGGLLARAVEAAVERCRPDVVHNNCASPEVVELAGSGCAFVSTLHTPPLPDLAEALTRNHQVVVTPSFSNAAAWSAVGCDARVIPNGVDRSRFRFGPGRGGYLVWTGRLVPEKGAHLAIAAARLLEMPLRIAGPAHDPGYFAEHILPSLESDVVSYEGHLGTDATARLLGRAECALVTPLWSEPFGLVVAEALACGSPVAGFAMGALPELLDESVSSLTGDLDQRALAAAALVAVGLGRRRCRAFSARFSLDLMVDRYERCYRRALIEAGPTASGSRHGSRKMPGRDAGPGQVLTTAS